MMKLTEELVATVKMRWRIERDYLELKKELGLGHYEGRNWRGFLYGAVADPDDGLIGEEQFARGERTPQPRLEPA